MTTKTRYFVIVSLLVLTVGLGTGLVAYYVGFPSGADHGIDELRFVPRNATLVAYADVQAVMVSEVRQKILQVLPNRGNGQQEFQDQTGINIDTDIDRVVACLVPSSQASQGPHVAGMVLARGRFNATKIEALMREHGAQAEDYHGARLIVAEVDTKADGARSLSVAFLEKGSVVAVGSTEAVRTAIDLKAADNITSSEEVMSLVRSLDGNVWVVGNVEALRSQAKLPAGVASQLPPIAWFSASGHVDGGVSGVVRADARDDESGKNLRDVVQGVVALAKFQTVSHPELKSAVDSLLLGGSGKTVTLAFDVSPQMLDALVGAAQGFRRGPPHSGK